MIVLELKVNTAKPSKLPLAMAIVLTLVGVGRIVSTYHVFNQAYDETAHIACGMEWLDKGTFRMEPQHPPLPRVASALGPYLSGLRLPNIRAVDPTHPTDFDRYGAGNEILNAHGQYGRNLTLARVGTLPFFLLAALVTFFWARSLLGDWPAVLAVALVTTLPVVLGFCSVAYVDPALFAFLPAALFAWIRWLDAPRGWRSVVLGAAVAGAVLSNAPSIVFLPPCCLSILVCRRWTQKNSEESTAGQFSVESIRQIFRQWTRPAVIAFLSMCFVLWGGYRFSAEPVDQMFDHPKAKVQNSGLPSPLKSLALKVLSLNPRVPAPDFFRGIHNILGENSKLYPAYIFGKVKRGGWWYFYPVMLMFKTPPVFMFLGILGTGWALGHLYRGQNWKLAAPAVSVLTILFVGMFIKVNLGVRHILFIYPLLAIVAAYACCELWALRSRWPRFMPATLSALLLGLILSTIWIHPNYLSYTSVFAGSTPDKNILIGGDFDAGQNILRLSHLLAEHKVDHLHLRLYTSADLTQMNLPPFQTLALYEHATGWIAISNYHIRLGESPWFPATFNGYAWLEAYQPVATIDKTIRLYYIPETSETESHHAPTGR